MVRAEVILKDGTAVHDYRLDRGVIRAKAPGSLTLRERDGQVVTIAVAPNAEIFLRGAPIPLRASGSAHAGAHRPRKGDAPPVLVQAGG